MVRMKKEKALSYNHGILGKEVTETTNMRRYVFDFNLIRIFFFQIV